MLPLSEKNMRKLKKYIFYKWLKPGESLSLLKKKKKMGKYILRACYLKVFSNKAT